VTVPVGVPVPDDAGTNVAVSVTGAPRLPVFAGLVAKAPVTVFFDTVTLPEFVEVLPRKLASLL
jgi:hypothetical protein